ncbi:hypothetical protein [Flindersiella endophytica]
MDDVIRLAEESGTPGLSRKAFTNRWPHKDVFVNDAVVYSLLFRDKAADPVLEPSQLVQLPQASTLSAGIIDVADAHLDRLFHDPRSYLLVHIGPLLEHHPEARSEVLPTIRGTRAWFDGYTMLLASLGLALRPSWTSERLGLCLQALLDGFLFRYRIQPEDYQPTRWEGASLFADAVIAFCLGVIDVDRSSQTAREALDAAVARSQA